MKLKLSKFNPDEMKEHRIVLFIARRSGGKSTLMKDIMYRIARRVDLPMAMSPTEDTVAMFRQHIPPAFVYQGFLAKTVENMIGMQRDMSKKGRQKNVFLALDDCMFDKRVLQGESMRDLFMNGRHMNITFFNCMQYVMDMSPDLRSQVDYVFVLKENILSNKQKLWKYFFGMFSSFEDFSNVMDQVTAEYGCLVLDNTCPHTELNKCVYWYRADPHIGDFKMGRSVYWTMSNIVLKTQTQLDEEEQEREAERRRNATSALALANRKRRVTLVEKHDEYGQPLEHENEDTNVTFLISN